MGWAPWTGLSAVDLGDVTSCAGDGGKGFSALSLADGLDPGWRPCHCSPSAVLLSLQSSPAAVGLAVALVALPRGTLRGCFILEFDVCCNFFITFCQLGGIAAIYSP